MKDIGIANEYVPVSRLAIAAAVAGLLSALALMSPICWVLPLVGIGLAVAGLADVNREGARKAGGIAAIAGLALSVGFGAQAVTGTVVGRWLVERRAMAAAEHWIDAVRAGRIADAISICGPGALSELDRPADSADARDPSVVERAFAAQAAVQAVASCGAAARPRIVAAAPAGDQNEQGWVVRATLEPCAGRGEFLRLVVEPAMVGQQGGPVERWRVTRFDLER
jgi:hypothetical protein